jgi:Berberine and berberine like
MDAVSAVASTPGSYVSESNFFEPVWQQAFWDSNYSRLAAVNRRYDPEGLFFVHHGVGSEGWSADGFTRLDSQLRSSDALHAADVLSRNPGRSDA